MKPVGPVVYRVPEKFPDIVITVLAPYGRPFFFLLHCGRVAVNVCVRRSRFKLICS